MEKGDIKLFSMFILLIAVIAMVSVSAAKTECSDGRDNDGDGAKDLKDKGCESRGDTSERSPNIVCDDGIDNDGDGKNDYGSASTNDAGCTSRTDTDETDCGDGVASGAETCDGQNLNGQTCVTQGFDGGTLTCASTCQSFVTTSCWTNSCADTDGGVVYGTKGTASGNYQGSPFSYTDSCSFDYLTEYLCNGKLKDVRFEDCNGGNGTNGTNSSWTGCANGACY